MLDRQLQNMQPLSAGERGHVIEVDTSQARAFEKALAAIQNRFATHEFNWG